MSNETFKHILVITEYTVKECLKNKILWIAVVLSIFGIAVASFVGDFSVIESRQTEVGALSSFYRFCAAFGTIVLVVSTMVREFNDKCLELYLSLPISRFIYFAGKLSGFFVASIAVALIYSLSLLLYADWLPVSFWLFSLICELIILTALSFFCVMTFNQQIPASVVTAFFFYLLARLSDYIDLVSQSELIIHTLGAKYLEFIIQGIIIVLPALARFTQPEWLIYNDFNALELAPVIIIQTLVYTLLLGAATLIDFTRKNI